MSTCSVSTLRSSGAVVATSPTTAGNAQPVLDVVAMRRGDVPLEAPPRRGRPRPSPQARRGGASRNRVAVRLQDVVDQSLLGTEVRVEAADREPRAAHHVGHDGRPRCPPGSQEARGGGRDCLVGALFLLGAWAHDSSPSFRPERPPPVDEELDPNDEARVVGCEEAPRRSRRDVLGATDATERDAIAGREPPPGPRAVRPGEPLQPWRVDGARAHDVDADVAVFQVRRPRARERSEWPPSSRCTRCGPRSPWSRRSRSTG